MLVLAVEDGGEQEGLFVGEEIGETVGIVKRLVISQNYNQLLLLLFEMQILSGRDGYKQCFQCAVKLRGVHSFPAGGNIAGLTSLDPAETDRQTETHRARQRETDSERQIEVRRT